MEFRKVVLFFRYDSGWYRKLAPPAFLLAVVTVATVVTTALWAQFMIGFILYVNVDGPPFVFTLATGIVALAVPYLLFCLYAGYAHFVARRVADGWHMALANWREAPVRAYLRWGLHTSLPLVAWLALAVLVAGRLGDPTEAPGELTPTDVQQVIVLLAVMAVGLTLWIPPTVRYVQQDSFSVYFRPNTWLAMLRRPYLAIWARATLYGMLLTGLTFVTLLMLAGVPILTSAAGLVFEFFRYGVGAALFTMFSMGVAHLIGQAARVTNPADTPGTERDSKGPGYVTIG